MKQTIVFVESAITGFNTHLQSSSQCAVTTGEKRRNGAIRCPVCEKVFVHPLRGKEAVIVFDGDKERSAQLQTVLEGGMKAEVIFERGEDRERVKLTLPFSPSPQPGCFALAL
jgi:hypothetical protein